jgi:hypothetical protein
MSEFIKRGSRNILWSCWLITSLESLVSKEFGVSDFILVRFVKNSVIEKPVPMILTG